jgi:tetratricopeptide (TPR) repeat protein
MAVSLGLVALFFGCHRLPRTGWKVTKKPLSCPAVSAVERSETDRISLAAKAITTLDVVTAQQLLGLVISREPAVTLLRARLAISVGECEGASQLFANRTNLSLVELETSRVAEGCARAMAGSEVVVDEVHNVWVRLQNPRDRLLVPLIAEVVERAANAIGQHLHTDLPRPLRIELVSDQQSLSYLTGLPLNAAETTGTVAIARWGKVTMLSPRATREGYPWQDTLAHELTHLAVSRLSLDEAPLWLQEGIAKREETAWRPSRPQDDDSAARCLARRALLEGRSVGINQLGASIALQPTPAAAETAYAEVEDFLDYLLRQVGDSALRLLLSDLRGLGGGSVDRALRSVTGYCLDEWIRRWQNNLLNDVFAANVGAKKTEVSGIGEASVSKASLEELRRLRLAALLSARRHWGTVASLLATEQNTSNLEVRWRRALAESKLGHWRTAEQVLGELESASRLDGIWLAEYGRVVLQSGRFDIAERAFEQSLSIAPTLERVACRGEARIDRDETTGVAILPTLEPYRSLCLDVAGSEAP